MSDSDDTRREELSKDRTDLAEDRTVLANERTFASWIRTGLAAAAIGLGFQALFVRMEPWWAPRAIATVFFVLAVFIFLAAERRSCAVLERLSAHQVKPFQNTRIRLMAALASLGVAALTAAMWLLPISAD
jgi:putative membrane protein